MSLSRRRSLPHDVPAWVDPTREVYFLSISCQRRGVNQLATPTVAWPLLETVAKRQERGLWFAHLVLIMPGHVHGLVSFPPGGRTMVGVVADWKRWTARRLGIGWQENFFEHRLRQEESAGEKAEYIRMNPVRAGLVERAEDWPYVWTGGWVIRIEGR